MRETKLKWFEHIKRRRINVPVRRCETINLMHYRRIRRRSKTNWNEIIKGDLKFMGLIKDMTQDKNL